ncbi:MFS transporter [Nostoc sp. ChiSLP03a]|uniref:MFS transporter n=1 Tax=Nostoc sp. ChiSLP03a TaxID=3075380 RepID=UPI002AD38C3B|nr:MFS transporter [Nostoc sp. ChiSLP03a]MDZ8210073.1 MFS transporter [Nostoc sp. ChiSLP03a]
MNSGKAKLILFLIVFIDLVGFGIILPLLPLYAQHYGAKPHLATLLLAVYSLMQFFFTPMWGSISDCYGRRPILLLTLFGTVIANIGLGLSSSLWMLFVARSLAGIMGANLSVAMAYMADITTSENRSRGIGMLGAGIGLGFIFGPAIGGILTGSDRYNPNFHLPAFAAAGLSLLALTLALKALPESLNPEIKTQTRASHKPNNRLEAFREVLQQRPQIGLLVVMSFLVVFPFSCVQSIFPLWLEQQFHWEPKQISYLFVFIGIVSASIQGGLIGWFTKRFGEQKVLILGVTAFGLGLLFVPFSKNLVLLLSAITLLAGGFALSQTTVSSLGSRFAGVEQQGKTLGILNSASSLARISGPTWAGFSFGAFGSSTPFLSGVLILVVAIALSWRILKQPPNCLTAL